MNTKLEEIVRGAFIIVLGFLVAFVNATTALNTYFGVAAIIAGVILLGIAAVAIAKKYPLPIAELLGAGVSITIAVALFMNKLSLGVILDILIFVMMGLGFGLVAIGFIEIAKRLFINGLVTVIVGGMFILFTALYLGLDSFREAFWIIVGVLMIAYGVFYIVVALATKTGKKKKK